MKHIRATIAMVSALYLSATCLTTAAPADDTQPDPAAPQNLRISVGDRVQAPRTARPNPKELKGKKAPDFTLDLLDGGTFKLSEHEGKSIVLLDFWATWCGPCRRVMPALQEVSKDYHDKGVRYFAVDLREAPDKIKAYLEQQKLDIAVPLDKDGSVARKYMVSGIPSMFIIDKKGIIRDVHVGASSGLKKSLEKTLDEILAGS